MTRTDKAVSPWWAEWSNKTTKMPFWMGWVGAQQHRPNHLHLKNVQNHHVVLPAPEALTCHARADTYRPLRGEMWVAVLLATWQQRITSPHMHTVSYLKTHPFWSIRTARDGTALTIIFRPRLGGIDVGWRIKAWSLNGDFTNRMHLERGKLRLDGLLPTVIVHERQFPASCT